MELSSSILVGKVVRVFFKRDGVEMQGDPDNPFDVASYLEIEVRNVLLNKDQALPPVILINYPNDGSGGAALRSRYLDKELIYFVQVIRTRRTANNSIVVDEYRRFTRGRRTVFPHPMGYFDEVSRSVEAFRARSGLGKR